eukprot:CAMPEP_0201521732 /NCGR_PEP_ID=MMETSP0161_2-20130828/15864_1 /ASSEMBLY_ACC=CAM_ASM_000251 /TAXON_ID=180227 /ORGANISM="Neoparamoeba aestuarina, Strain SoJaBio B1-5/56/2" /LENGTH=603 /DNA_ID=CAMNT_0047920421 /DNA_START=60 /DNA_END=1871 /DNA_ORIENTATION=-
MGKIAVVFFCLMALGYVFASSHSEAPGTTKMPQADNVDLYFFRSYETGREEYTTIIQNFQPLQNPYGGPNYFSFSDQFFYILHIDWDGDAVSDKDIEIFFGQRLGGDEFSTGFEADFGDCVLTPPTNPELKHTGLEIPILLENGTQSGVNTTVALKFVGPIDAADDQDLNWFEYYRISMVEGDGNRTQVINPATSGFQFTKPFDYAGEKTFGDASAYETYARSFIHTFDPGNCSDLDAKVWVGQRLEGFNINLGPIFDLVNFIPIEGFIEQSDVNNYLRFINVGTIALEMPTECIVKDDPVVGAWSTVNQLCHDGNDHVPGRQVSRLGMPLVNELVIGLAEKGDFNSQNPLQDGNFSQFVTHPSFPAILNLLFRDAVNSVLGTSFQNIAPFNLPREDLVAVFLTGIPGLNQPQNVTASEMMRLNTDIAPRAASAQNFLGVIDSDTSGFPNGRRPGDDVVDIVLRVAMGKLCDLSLFCTPDQAPVGGLNFTDGAPVDASYFDDFFPYLRTPVTGSPYPGIVQPCIQDDTDCDCPGETDCPDTEACPDCDSCCSPCTDDDDEEGDDDCDPCICPPIDDDDDCAGSGLFVSFVALFVGVVAFLRQF